jgi:hypothetical protein
MMRSVTGTHRKKLRARGMPAWRKPGGFPARQAPAPGPAISARATGRGEYVPDPASVVGGLTQAQIDQAEGRPDDLYVPVHQYFCGLDRDHEALRRGSPQVVGA